MKKIKKNRRMILLIIIVIAIVVFIYFNLKNNETEYINLIVGGGGYQILKFRNVKDFAISKAGIDFIKKFEGFRAKAYNDARIPPVLTIGYGHTKNVYAGQVITEEQATIFLKEDLALAEKRVKNNVKIAISQNQYDALVSHVFNNGISTTLFKIINLGTSQVYKGNLYDLQKWWTTTYITAGSSSELAGLVTRRKEEYLIYTT
tara:strand:+ start:684 stop:1295 length:612 start_codon:yes stop_codon:yes gene_type:complete